MSLRWRLVGTYVLLVAVAGLMSTYFVGYAWRSFNLRGREMTYVTQASIASGLLAPRLGEGPGAWAQVLADLAGPQGVRLILTDRLGTVIGDSGVEASMMGRPLGRDEVNQALAGGRGSSVGRLDDGGWALYVAVPVYREKQVAGAVFLAADVGDVFEAGRVLEGWLLAATAAGCALAAALGLLLSRAVMRPMDHLRQAAGRLAAGDFSCRVPDQSMSEMRELGRAFNHMALALEEGDSTRRLFAAGAAHELKSPLASMKAMIDSLLSRTGQGEDVYREFLSDIDREVDRLTHLSDTLLVLARLEQGRAVLRRQIIPMDDLVEQAAGLVARRASVVGARISVEASPFEVWADGDLVELALVNLLDNAIKYSPAGEEITVRTRQRGGGVEITVADMGPGIDQADVDRVFDRFYRTDQARTRHTGGAGLGLALVREVAYLHGGKVEARSGPGEGTRMIMWLPAGP